MKNAILLDDSFCDCGGGTMPVIDFGVGVNSAQNKSWKSKKPIIRLK
jgi:hypothetical protein